ncbi:hypothetical protein EHS39_06375 [Ensifer sp. MPMI2T]|nr:hypothetical protein EHS39_06375 [Ensifer sp. MPMI2T]
MLAVFTPWIVSDRLQRRASYQTRTRRCNTLNCCMFLSLNRLRFKETCSRDRSKGSVTHQVWRWSSRCRTEWRRARSQAGLRHRV